MGYTLQAIHYGLYTIRPTLTLHNIALHFNQLELVTGNHDYQKITFSVII